MFRPRRQLSSGTGRHAGRSRAREWAAVWFAVAVFGAWPLTEGSLAAAAAFWAVPAVFLVFTWVAMCRVKQGRRRKSITKTPPRSPG